MKAADAVEIDTTGVPIDEVIDRVLSLVNRPR
jgi:cytidylate kinase